jgi:hypothetical protein
MDEFYKVEEQIFDSDLIEGAERQCGIWREDVRNNSDETTKVGQKLEDLGLIPTIMHDYREKAKSIKNDIDNSEANLRSYCDSMITAEEEGMDRLNGDNVVIYIPTDVPAVPSFFQSSEIESLPSLDESLVNIEVGPTSTVVDTSTESLPSLNDTSVNIEVGQPSNVVENTPEINTEKVNLVNILPEVLRDMNDTSEKLEVEKQNLSDEINKETQENSQVTEEQIPDIQTESTEQANDQIIVESLDDNTPQEGSGGIYSFGPEITPESTSSETSGATIVDYANSFSQGIGSGI